MASSKNPADDAFKGKANRELRVGQMNFLLPPEIHIKLGHSVMTKLSGGELQRNNVKANRSAETASTPIGLDCELSCGDKTYKVIIRYFSDPDIFYKAPSCMKANKVAEMLEDVIWLFVDNPKDCPEFIHYRLVKDSEIRQIRGIGWEMPGYDGNETRWHYLLRGKILPPFPADPVEGLKNPLNRIPSFVEVVKNLFK